MAKSNLNNETLSSATNRLNLLKQLAAAGAIAGVAQLPLGAQAPVPSDVVQFALNLEYLQAEFYSVATTGQTLTQRGFNFLGPGAGATTTSFGVPRVRSFRVGRRVLIKREWIDDWLETANQEVARQC
jgi:hypothetical protein